MSRPPISLEFLYWLFRTRRGLFLLGAGASSSVAPFGTEFFQGPPLDYIQGGAFPVSVPAHDFLTRRLIHATSSLSLDHILPGRVIRPGTNDLPFHELLERIPNSYARVHLMRTLSTARFLGWPCDNYTVFRLFRPAMLLNYNLDGLATEWCVDIHEVVTPHGTVPKAYGSPHMAQYLEIFRDYDVKLRPDALVRSVPESWNFQHLHYCLDDMDNSAPEFIAMIGYSFGRNGNSYDDWIFLKRFNRAFRNFAGPVFIIEPRPAQLREVISEGIASDQVYSVAGYWNAIAHVFLEFYRGRAGNRSLNYACEQLLDQYGDRVAFPIVATFD